MRGRKESNEGSREKEGILSKVRKGKVQSDMEVDVLKSPMALKETLKLFLGKQRR